MAIIDKPSDYFETKLYTGDDTNNREISLGLTPDLTWIKARNVAYGHSLFDRIRGLGFSLSSNNSNADRNVGSEFSWSNSGCTTDSFTVDRGSNESLNESGRPMVAWNWKAGGTAVSNTDGSITSSVSANQTAGFSIVSYTGNGTAGATVGHGLSSAPRMVLVKNRNTTNSWEVFHASMGATKVILLNRNEAEQTSSSSWNNTAPTSSVFSIGTAAGTNGNGNSLIAYCLAEKQGYSKFGSYVGNGNADGTFVYTGMKPSFVMIKRTDSANSWQIIDNKRNSFNLSDKLLFPDLSDAEATSSGNGIDLLSNGFKTRGTGSQTNASGGTYIYMAFAENPFVSSTSVPATAR